MKTTTRKTEQTLDVAVLYLDDKPQGLMTEPELLNHRGKIWWDYIELYTITTDDYNLRDLDHIVWKYVKK